MNKITSTLLFLLVLIACSCQEKIQSTHGKVKKMTDSTLVAIIDKYDIVFDIKDARYDNGAVMFGDSVIIHYVGDLREKKAKALLFKLIPQPGKVVEAVYDPSKELVTAPMTPDEKKQFDKGIDFAKKHGH